MYSDLVCHNYCLWWWRSYTWLWLHGFYYWYWERNNRLHFSNCIWMLRVVEGPRGKERCVARWAQILDVLLVCHILHDLHGIPNTGWWHHAVTPMCNIPVKEEIFLPLCEPHLPLMPWYQNMQLQGSRPVLWPGWACCLRAAPQAAERLLVTN